VLDMKDEVIVECLGAWAAHSKGLNRVSDEKTDFTTDPRIRRLVTEAPIKTKKTRVCKRTRGGDRRNIPRAWEGWITKTRKGHQLPYV